MNSVDEVSEGIIVTLPGRFFKEYGMRNYLQDVANMNNDENAIWYRVMKNLPKKDFLYIYVVIGRRVKHRFNFAGLERNVTRSFSRPNGGIRTFENANMILMAGPVVKAPMIIPMRGFQGFRYTHKLF